LDRVTPPFEKRKRRGQLRGDALTQALYASYQRTGKELHYWAGYFLRALKAWGGLAVAKRILAKRGKGALTKGFLNLVDAGRPDLSVEWIALLPQFRKKFTQEELRIAEERIKAHFNTRPPTAVKVSIVYPDEVPERRNYVAGAVSQVLVNRYERDPRARDACLKKLGRRCRVCNLRFKDRYGEIGEGFIHVHHIKPLAATRRQYRLNPEKDLVPVCPNCHAMLHKKEPPLFIHELQKLLRKEYR
jgi:5-methylcytosine-specific restriction enzyme A